MTRGASWGRSPRTALRSTTSREKRRMASPSPRSSARRRRTRKAGSPGKRPRTAIRAGKKEKFGETDEPPFKANLEKIPTLKPAFRKDGTVTAANSSSISDGAGALVMMRPSGAESRGLAPLAVVMGHATHAQAPSEFTTAPVGAIKHLFERTGWAAKQVDLYEINEAFAVLPMRS